MDCFCSNCGKKYSINPSKIPAGRKYAKCKACVPLRAAKKCGKCGYIRKSTDTAPDWECPECGIIYEKVDKKIKDSFRKEEKKLFLFGRIEGK